MVWIKIGQGCLIGRAWAMRKAGTNQPMGRGFNEAFSAWLSAYKLNDIDQADRSNLRKLMDRRKFRSGATSFRTTSATS